MRPGRAERIKPLGALIQREQHCVWT